MWRAEMALELKTNICQSLIQAWWVGSSDVNWKVKSLLLSRWATNKASGERKNEHFSLFASHTLSKYDATPPFVYWNEIKPITHARFTPTLGKTGITT